MTKRKALTLLGVAILAALVYSQYRNWSATFNWGDFSRATTHVNWWYIALGVLLTYFAYVLRAVRWAIFLEPVQRTPFQQLIPSQVIGFTGLALLGRPGELIRPYLVARKLNLSVASQLAVWTVERIFDMGAFAVLMVLTIFLGGERLPNADSLDRGAIVLALIVGGLAFAMFAIRRNSEGVARFLERLLTPLSPGVAASAGRKVHAFGEGLQTIRDLKAFARITLVSLLMWSVIAAVYYFVLHAYEGSLDNLSISHMVLLMGSSMVGSMIQLPAVGGGSQAATISMMIYWFKIPAELAASAGLLLWLVSFMAVIPLGLILARREHTSLTALSKETKQTEPA